MTDGAADRARDAAAELRERDAFILLVHTQTMADAHPDHEVSESRLARDLAFEPARLEEILETATDRGRDGGRWPALPRLAGNVAGAYAAAAWEPGDEISTDVVRIATRTLVFGTLGSLWKEFVGWP